MRILTRYLVRAHLGPFFFALSVLTGLLLVNTIARRFEELAGKGLPVSVIAEVFGLSIPYTFALTLPMAVLVAVLYAFSQLAAENEITALKASGVNLARLLGPLVVASTLLAGGMVWFNDRVLPEANHKLRTLLVDIARKSPTLDLKEQVINEIQTGDYRTRYYLQAARVEPATNRLRDVVIYDMSVPNRERTIYADSGRMAFNRQQTDLFLTLFDGRVQEMNAQDPGRYHIFFFTRQLTRIEGIGNQLERTAVGGDRYRGDREMSLGMLAAEADAALAELRQVQEEAARRAREAVERALEPAFRAPRRTPGDRGDETGRPLRLSPPSRAPDGEAGAEAGSIRPPRGTKLPARIPAASAAGRPGQAAGATASAGSDRGTPGVVPDGKLASTLARASLVSGGPEAEDALVRRASVELSALRNQAEMLESRINSYRVEYHKKFSIPFACIVFVLLGAPLAVRFPRGGVGMVIAVSLTIFTVYWMTLIGGEELADKGLISPFWAMWAPNALFLALGLWGLTRVGREVSTTRGGGWDDMWHSFGGVLTLRRVRRRLGRA